MAKVTQAVDTPISSDESNTTLDSVRNIIEKKAASVLNIKISKNGGLYRCKKIAALAEAAGIPIIVGGANTYEIGRQASRHFAVSTAQVQMGFGSEGCAPASQSKIDDVTKKVVTYEDVSKMKGYVVVSLKYAMVSFNVKPLSDESTDVVIINTKRVLREAWERV